MKFIHFFLAGIAGVLLSACSQTVSSDGNPLDFPEKKYFPGIDDISDTIEQELFYNYGLLNLGYLYAHTRNELADDYQVYLGQGTSADKSGKNFCSPEFYDICYMYNQMKDPFTRYFDHYVAQQVYANVMETKTVTGIGVEVDYADSANTQLKISQIYLHAPGEKAGLQVGDIIVQVDGIKVSTPSNFRAMCSGNKGDIVHITIERGTEIVEVPVTLAAYRTPSVTLHYEDSIPVIQIKEFSVKTPSDSGTYGEFITALRMTAGAKSTIIDLRDNPGGETDQCNHVSAEFLSMGDTIITDIEASEDSVYNGDYWIYSQAFDTTTYYALRDGLGKDRYYVLLADSNSASCAEIVLSSVSVNKKTPIVGQISYGKAIGQGVVDTPFKGLALVTAIIGVDKNGQTYHDVGIVPDYIIDDPNAQMAKAVELAKQATELRTAGYGTKKLNHFSKVSAHKAEQGFPTKHDLKLRFKRF